MILLNIRKKLRAANGPMDLDISTELEEGQIVALYGVSGAGKTSLLRMIAGLMKPDDGEISVNGQTWFESDSRTNLIPQKRNTGFVFQDYALFPHFTVEGNLRFALPRGTADLLVTDMMERFGLTQFRNEQPSTLSGGQQQRVALARALIQSPNVLLLDEPLSALDYSLRKNLQEFITRVNREKGTSVFLVSHDLGEIFRVAHKVVIIDDGKITAAGIPKEVFSQKQVSGKFRFTGEVLSITKEDIIYVARVLIGTDVIKVVLDAAEAKELHAGDRVLVASKAFNPIIQRID